MNERLQRSLGNDDFYNDETIHYRIAWAKWCTKFVKPFGKSLH